MKLRAWFGAWNHHGYHWLCCTIQQNGFGLLQTGHIYRPQGYLQCKIHYQWIVSLEFICFQCGWECNPFFKPILGSPNFASNSSPRRLPAARTKHLTLVTKSAWVWKRHSLESSFTARNSQPSYVFINCSPCNVLYDDLVFTAWLLQTPSLEQPTDDLVDRRSGKLLACLYTGTTTNIWPPSYTKRSQCSTYYSLCGSCTLLIVTTPRHYIQPAKHPSRRLPI